MLSKGKKVIFPKDCGVSNVKISDFGKEEEKS